MSVISRYNSHPGRRLEDHLQGVAELAHKTMAGLRLDLPDHFSKNLLTDLLYIMGICHDLGKASPFFQEYLLGTDEGRRAELKAMPETHHGAISSFYTFWLVEQLLRRWDRSFAEQGWAYFTFFMVKRHHGSPLNLFSSEQDNSELDLRVEDVERQCRVIDRAWIESILEYFLGKTLEVQRPPFLENAAAWFEDCLRRPAKRFFRTLKRQEDRDLSLMVQLCYSILLHADKTDALYGGDQLDPPRPDLSEETVRLYREQHFPLPVSAMEQLRADMVRSVADEVEDLDLSKRVLSLNAPTGSGKTLVGFEAALRLRSRIANELGFTPRIIYCLPFTSIIDQNYDVFSQVLGDPASDVLMKHHHLADIVYTRTETDLDQAEKDDPLFLLEGWESEVVVTTFVQFFSTLLASRNNIIRRFFRLSNVLVILDEVQTIPHRYWLLVRDMLQRLTGLLNSHVLLMTATQPAIFEANEIHELLPDKACFFHSLDRIDLVYEPAPITFEDFCQQAFEAVAGSERSFLFVMNTVNSSLRLFEMLLEQGIPEERLVYLSTNVTPRERRQRIDDIRVRTGAVGSNSNEELGPVIVSTQVVEAGVDFDIHEVWRDGAPFDSLNQAAGRCNRHQARRRGLVRVFRIVNETGCEYSRFIYGRQGLCLSTTFELLDQTPRLREYDFLKVLDRYYRILKSGLATDHSREVLEQVSQLRYRDLSTFSLIDQAVWTSDIFIELDDEASRAWNEYRDVKTAFQDAQGRNFALRTELRRVRRRLAPYIISVDRRYVPESHGDPQRLVSIRQEDLDFFYDRRTGWKRTFEKGECHVF